MDFSPHTEMKLAKWKIFPIQRCCNTLFIFNKLTRHHVSRGETQGDRLVGGEAMSHVTWGNSHAVTKHMFLVVTTGAHFQMWNKSLLAIQLLEYPIPARPSSSQKPSSADISETESGIIDLLVSKQPEKFWIYKKGREKNNKEQQIGSLCDFLGFL